MKINQKLNLVVPVEREGGTAYVHAAPISREVFEDNFLVISKTFSEIYTSGLSYNTGPRVAMMMLKKVAESMDIWPDVQSGLVAEMRRLANVVIPGSDTIPLQEALDKKLFNADDVSEVENAIAFFTVASAVHRQKDGNPVVRQAAKLWGAQTTPLNVTEWADFLRTSTTEGNSGGTAAA